jgi:hypothetical protein
MTDLYPHNESKIVVIENSAEMLRVQTRCETPAAGVVSLFTLIVILTVGLAAIYKCLLVNFWLGLGILPLAIFGFWSALVMIVDGFGWDDLKISDHEIRFDRFFGPVPLRTYQAPLDEVTGLKLIDRKFYCLKIRTKRWSALFGFEDRPTTLEAIRNELEKRIEGGTPAA